MYEIEPIFLVFPIMCLLFHKHGKAGKIKTLLFLLLLIGIYCCSLNGSDIAGYEELYNKVGAGIPLEEIHGEIGYKLLMVLSHKRGLSYTEFRLLFLSANTMVLFYAIYKLSPDLLLSLYVFSTLFVVYIISAYRQYMVMSCLFFFYYVYLKGYHTAAIAGLILLLSIHISAMAPLFMLLIYMMVDNRKIEEVNRFMAGNILSIVFMALILRGIIFLLMEEQLIYGIVHTILGEHSGESGMLFCKGLLSRTVFLLGISYMYYVAKTKDQSIQMLYVMYGMGIIAYIVIPLEFTMGRLTNNLNIIGALLIPGLTTGKGEKGKSANIGIRKVVTLGLIGISFLVLINQLANQDGYAPYKSILFAIG